MGFATRTLVVLSLLAAAGCAATQEESLRIGTFNAQFLPSTFNGMPAGDDVERPRRISARIRASSYDIIVLNEIFDEDSRDEFVKELEGTFPHYVAYIGDDAIASEDSGLMLFSRFPFAPLPLTTHRVEADDVKAKSGGADWKDVAFIEYDASARSDDMAAKGAAMVRVQNPFTGRIYNIVFTHMQASYPEDENVGLCPEPVPAPGVIDLRVAARDQWAEMIDIRRQQFRDVERVIEESLPPGLSGREDVFLIGDLNVDGDQADPDLGAGACCRPNLYEWVQRFATAGSYLTDRLRDAWVAEHPREDRGLTNYYHWAVPPGDRRCVSFEPETGARLDYFARNRPSPDRRRLVVQHLTRAFNLRDGEPFVEGGLGMMGTTDLSDHIGVNADINRWAPHATPLEARANPAFDTFIPGDIRYPGSMQWARFDTPGTYAFAVLPANSGVDFRVYQAADLSVPAPQYFEETITFTAGDPRRRTEITAKKFHVPDPPLYVRVFNPLRTATGTYALVAHRATCTSANEACVLRANDPLVHALPAAPQNADDTSWFEVHVQKVTSGRPQNLRFFADGFAGDDFELQLRAADGVTILDSTSTTAPGPGGRQLELRRTTADAGKFYLVVRRTNLAAAEVRVGWTTNLTVLHGSRAGITNAVNYNIFCIEETDTIGIDEIYLSVMADGQVVVSDTYIGDFDNGRHRSLEDVIPTIRYVDSVTIRIRDADDAANGGDDIMEVVIGALPPDQTSALGETRTASCCDGAYTVRFNRSRSLPIDGP